MYTICSQFAICSHKIRNALISRRYSSLTPAPAAARRPVRSRGGRRFRPGTGTHSAADSAAPPAGISARRPRREMPRLTANASPAGTAPGAKLNRHLGNFGVAFNHHRHNNNPGAGD
jgi:hypothetical protein